MSSILLCVDATRITDAMLEKCIELVSGTGDQLHLLHVCRGSKPSPKYVSQSGVHNEKSAWRRLEISHCLQKALLRLRNAGVKATSHVATGPVACKIAEKARDLKADMLVMGCRTNNAFHHLLHGSIPAEVMKQTDLPVMLLKTA